MSAIDELAKGLRRRWSTRRATGAPGHGQDPRALRGRIAELLREQTQLLDREQHDALVERVLSSALGLGPLEALLQDPSVDEIMVNGAEQVLAERNGRIERTEIAFQSETELMHVIERILSPLGRRVDEASPLVDARLPDGSRVNCVIAPLSLDGPLLTIRRFRRRGFTIGELVETRFMTRSAADFLESCVRARLNLVVSGGTGSGKTTLLNVLST